MEEITTVWEMKKCDMQLVKELAYELAIPQSVAQVMVTRGIDTTQKAKKFFSLDIKKLHNPMLLPDAKKAIDDINIVIKDEEEKEKRTSKKEESKKKKKSSKKGKRLRM